MTERARILEAWKFDGSKESVEDALSRYPRLKYAWRAGGDSILTFGRHTVRAGSWLARMDDGSFQPRSEKTVRNSGVLDPVAAADEDQDPEDHLEYEAEDFHRAPFKEKPQGVAAWFFDGTEESIVDALRKHDDLHFVKHPDGNYVVHAVLTGPAHKPRYSKVRFKPGKCIVLLQDGSFTRWQYRGARKQGLVPRRSRK